MICAKFLWRVYAFGYFAGRKRDGGLGEFLAPPKCQNRFDKQSSSAPHVCIYIHLYRLDLLVPNPAAEEEGAAALYVRQVGRRQIQGTRVYSCVTALTLDDVRPLQAGPAVDASAQYIVCRQDLTVFQISNTRTHTRTNNVTPQAIQWVPA